MNRDYNYIALGDCVELMKEIPDDFIDLTVTSPPYDNLRNYNNEVTWNFENFKCVAMFPATWQCKYYNGPYTTDCPFGEREYKEVEHDA